MKHITCILLILSFLLAGCAPSDIPQETTQNPTLDTQSTTVVTTPSKETEPTVTEPAGTEPVTAPTEPTETQEPTTQPTVALSLPESLLLGMSPEEKVG